MKNYMRQKASFILSEREKHIYMDERELKKNGFQSSLFLKGFFLVNKKEKKNVQIMHRKNGIFGSVRQLYSLKASQS